MKFHYKVDKVQRCNFKYLSQREILPGFFVPLVEQAILKWTGTQFKLKIFLISLSPFLLNQGIFDVQPNFEYKLSIYHRDTEVTILYLIDLALFLWLFLYQIICLLLLIYRVIQMYVQGTLVLMHFDNRQSACYFVFTNIYMYVNHHNDVKMRLIPVV